MLASDPRTCITLSTSLSLYALLVLKAYLSVEGTLLSNKMEIIITHYKLSSKIPHSQPMPLPKHSHIVFALLILPFSFKSCSSFCSIRLIRISACPSSHHLWSRLTWNAVMINGIAIASVTPAKNSSQPNFCKKTIYVHLPIMRNVYPIFNIPSALGVS